MNTLRSHGRDSLASEELVHRLDEGLTLLGEATSPMQRRQLLDYLALLRQWNAIYNLTSIRNPLDMISVHLLDSLSIASVIADHSDGDVLDVGSGAGLPGIPLAVRFPARMIHSVDAVAKKIGFQLQVKASLGLRNFFPLHRRVEALTLTKKPSLIVSRAYAELCQMLRSIDHIAGPETIVVAMKGTVSDLEMAAVPTSWTVLQTRPLDVPFLGARRCAVILQRAP